ncbi:TIGR02452 family protein [Thiorhodovibrio winogradskyi]|uniref:TIGR02452 family protein n=1 Tax=Thiorhodovibrio winogradskyi TaxID=77007 RepID=UPI002E2D4C8C|nr:TIGR02452 family protein [Thiorhodovibrio winogradskyi]
MRRSIPPDEPLPTADRCAAETTRVQVANETTLAAAEHLTRAGTRSVLALNFANGVHPGGGFLHGAHAQEEVLCRSSALYATLGRRPDVRRPPATPAARFHRLGHLLPAGAGVSPR